MRPPLPNKNSKSVSTIREDVYLSCHGEDLQLLPLRLLLLLLLLLLLGLRLLLLLLCLLLLLPLLWLLLRLLLLHPPNSKQVVKHRNDFKVDFPEIAFIVRGVQYMREGIRKSET